MTTTAEGKRKRVVSGMRPTGRLHIGHYFGALQNWVRLQDSVSSDGDKEYDCFYFVADWHALTSDYANTFGITRNVMELTMDWLAAGLDPNRSTIFLQSAVPEHAELHLLLSMITPLGWLERVPTYKEQLENVKDKDLSTFGFLGYPVLQTADIVIYSKGASALFVPVGEDQVSHIEFSRELVRKFNFHYGLRMSRSAFQRAGMEAWGRLLSDMELLSISGPREGVDELSLMVTLKKAVSDRIAEIGYQNALHQLAVSKRIFWMRDVLCEPEKLLTDTPKVPGIDGRKMSKSYGNAIYFTDSDEEILAKTKKMVTDPARIKRSDPGNPDVCPVFSWHKLFSPEATIAQVNSECRTAAIGCVQCKEMVGTNLIKWIEPRRERRLGFQKQPKLVREILEKGSLQARQTARKTMLDVRKGLFGELRIRRRLKKVSRRRKKRK